MAFLALRIDASLGNLFRDSKSLEAKGDRWGQGKLSAHSIASEDQGGPRHPTEPDWQGQWRLLRYL